MSAKKQKLSSKLNKNQKTKVAVAKRKPSTKKGTTKKKVQRQSITVRKKLTIIEENLNEKKELVKEEFSKKKKKEVADSNSARLKTKKRKVDILKWLREFILVIKNFIIYIFDKAKNYKRLITITMIILIIFATGVAVYKKLDKQDVFTYYGAYQIGDKVVLPDGSIWYVVDYSNNKTARIKLLAEKPIDVNNDGKIDNKDKLPFDKNEKAEYNKKNEGNIAHYLEMTYKSTLGDLKGTIAVNLLTSKEYIKLRDSFEFGYEWKNGNFLASTTLGYWWINTIQNSKVYTVNTIGSYVLLPSTKENYVRPVITIDKVNIK